MVNAYVSDKYNCVKLNKKTSRNRLKNALFLTTSKSQVKCIMFSGVQPLQNLHIKPQLLREFTRHININVFDQSIVINRA